MELNYVKRPESSLLSELNEIVDLEEAQNYIPIYGKFFNLTEGNYNMIQLNNSQYLSNVESKISDNIYKAKVKTLNNDERKEEVFFKFCPLMDPVKYMIGKFDLSDNYLNKLPGLYDYDNNTLMQSKTGGIVLDKNNIPYVDGFFSFLSSKLMETVPTFLNGLNYYGSHIGFKNNFKVNVIDDIEELIKADFFTDNLNNLFTIDEKIYGDSYIFHSRNNLKRLSIKSDVELVLDNVDELKINDIFFSDCKVVDNSDNDAQQIDISISTLSSGKKSSSIKSSSSSCSTRTSNTDSENMSDFDEDEDEDEDEDDDEDEDEDEDEEEQILVNIKKYPVQAICIEKCDNTLDDYMINNDIDDKEWISILLQVIMNLITYQKVFKFTHNDLHTSNIMYNNTKKEFIYYCVNNTYYKVPTFGKIYKIIDFGRSIYTYKGNLICSNSYAQHGEATSQYNFEPYFNDKKPRLEPNYSFDLCRLACSLFDHLIDSYLDFIHDPDDFTDIAALINDWCIDDFGKNVLYKSNGKERYPDFKLYKMIARSVHKHTPDKQLERELFNIYKVSRKTINKKALANVFNIDKLEPQY